MRTSVWKNALPVDPIRVSASSGLIRQAGPHVSVSPYTWWISRPRPAYSSISDGGTGAAPLMIQRSRNGWCTSGR